MAKKDTGSFSLSYLKREETEGERGAKRERETRR